MNFLEITKSVRILSGAQGVGPLTVTGVTGYEATLVAFVKDAWLDIQNYREEWNFLKKSDSFFTAASKDTYTVSDILGPTNDFKKWDKDSLVITDAGRKYQLKRIDLGKLEEVYLNSIKESRPTVFAIDTSDSIVLKNIPGLMYNVDLKYWREPQILVADADVPLCKSSFHNLIVYKALEKAAIYLSSPEIYRNYSVEAARMLAQMMRVDNPAKVMKTRRPFA